MSVFHSNCCNQYLDSDKSGYHDIKDEGLLCDECKSKLQEEDIRESIYQFRKMLKEEMDEKQG